MGSLFRLVWVDLVATAIFQLIGALSIFAAALAMRELVDFLTTYQRGEAIPIRLLVCTALLFVGPAIQAIADGLTFFLCRCLILHYRAALTSLIFRKVAHTRTS